jgi:hypothetical protein
LPGLFRRHWNPGIDANTKARFREIEFEEFSRDDAGAVEGVIEPEIGGERVMRCGGDDTVFEEVVGLKAENADGFDANVVVGGIVQDGGIGIVGDGARENVGGSPRSVRDPDERNFDRLEAAVEIEV